jgi:hypothetical protein
MGRGRSYGPNIYDRLGAIPKRSIEDYECPVGSKEWHAKKRHPSALGIYSELYWNSMTEDEQNNLTKALRGQFRIGKTPAEIRHEELMENISDWIAQNGWLEIEGGEYNAMWVNPKYPDNIFPSGNLQRKGKIAGISYPLVPLHDDPKGLGCHIRVSGDGLHYTVCPNNWTSWEQTYYYKKILKRVNCSKRRKRRINESKDREFDEEMMKQMEEEKVKAAKKVHELLEKQRSSRERGKEKTSATIN